MSSGILVTPVSKLPEQLVGFKIELFPLLRVGIFPLGESFSEAILLFDSIPCSKGNIKMMHIEPPFEGLYNEIDELQVNGKPFIPRQFFDELKQALGHPQAVTVNPGRLGIILFFVCHGANCTINIDTLSIVKYIVPMAQMAQCGEGRVA